MVPIPGTVAPSPYLSAPGKSLTKVIYLLKSDWATLKRMSRSFAYLSQGELHLKLEDQPVRVVDSRFGQSVRERAIQIENRNSWKTQGTGARFMSGGALWGRQDQDAAEIPVVISGIAPGCHSGELLYSLTTPDIGGVFVVRNRASEEQRLLHTSDFRVRRLSAGNGHERIACAVRHKGQISCLAIMNADGSDLREVTQGDTIDDAPRWVPGSSRELVFQSAAIGRNAAGYAVAHGAFTIQRLDLESGSVTTVAEDANFDLLHPVPTESRDLYFIRRPYRDPMKAVSPWRAMLDFVFLPFRILYAVFQWVNYFTVRYTGNPLTTAGNARQRHADIRKMMVWDNLIAADQSMAFAREDRPVSAPKRWELVRRSPSGADEVLAKGVMSFDLYRNGEVLYSTGDAIFLLTKTGKKEELAKEPLIEQVMCLEI